LTLQATTWQTVGPFFSIALEHLVSDDIAPAGTAGDRVTIEGRVLDGNGKPVSDAVIETWQANAHGEYGVSGVTSGDRGEGVFTGFGRVATDVEGRFHFTTIRPGQVPGPDGIMQAPHLAVRVMMRGLLKGLVTRMYFPGEDVAADPILQLVPFSRRATLIGAPLADREATLEWNIELQGERETVFFDC
jgi:protocatechuate 3,4-dioxygenase, alpha subunit